MIIESIMRFTIFHCYHYEMKVIGFVINYALFRGVQLKRIEYFLPWLVKVVMAQVMKMSSVITMHAWFFLVFTIQDRLLCIETIFTQYFCMLKLPPLHLRSFSPLLWSIFTSTPRKCTRNTGRPLGWQRSFFMLECQCVSLYSFSAFCILCSINSILIHII